MVLNYHKLCFTFWELTLQSDGDGSIVKQRLDLLRVNLSGLTQK